MLLRCGSGVMAVLLMVLAFIFVGADENMVKPLAMDVEWVLQGNTIGFNGFFCELLGISKGLRALFPELRVGKSSFIKNFDEPHFGGKELSMENVHNMFEVQLFPEEAENLLALSYPSQIGQLSSLDTDKEDTQCANTTQIEFDVKYLGGNLARRYAPDALAPPDCCRACEDHPLCVAWSFGPEFIGEFVSTIGPAGKKLNKCSLKGSLPLDEHGTHTVDGAKASRNRPNQLMQKLESGFISGYMQKPVVPRALVFHGTMCLYRNESVHTYGRDINTLYVGRYMVERSSFPGGFSQDEYLVFSCTARMDEVWVPTEWHRQVFLQTLQSMGIPHNGHIAVIPEAIDTELFDPLLVRTPEDGNPFQIRSRSPEDGCVYRRKIQPKPKLLRRLLNKVKRVFKSRKKKSAVVSASQHDSTDASQQEFVVCPATEKFRFLSIFKWEYRKGWDVLLDSYWSTFSAEDDVVLVLRTYVPTWAHMDTNITHHIEEFAMKRFEKKPEQLARVIWESGEDASKLSDSLTREDVRDLYASVDAFVLPTRGEGWGLPIAEAMAMELPVIVTNATGVLAYANEDNAYLIPVLDHLDDMAFVKPDGKALEDILRQVVHDSGPDGTGRAQQKAAMAREKMQDLSPTYVAGLMADRLRVEAERRGWNFES